MENKNTRSIKQEAPRETADSAGDIGKLQFLKTNQQFNLLRTSVHSNSQSLKPRLEELVKGKPELLTLIKENQKEFLELINEPIVVFDGDVPAEHEGTGLKEHEGAGLKEHEGTELQEHDSSDSGSSSSSSSSESGSSSGSSESGSSSSSSDSASRKSSGYEGFCIFVLQFQVLHHYHEGLREAPEIEDEDNIVVSPERWIWFFKTAWNNANDTAGLDPRIEFSAVASAVRDASLETGRLITSFLVPKALPRARVLQLDLMWTIVGYLAGGFVKEQFEVEKQLDMTNWRHFFTFHKF